MVIYEDSRRVVARGITFINDKVLLIERFKRENDILLHYYTIPGGGVENNETKEEASVRETKEETCVDTKVIKYLEREEYPNGVCYWYYLEYLNGSPTLGGEEKERNSDDNHYKVVLIDINDLDSINILGRGKDLIKECYKLYKKN